eukprot:scaffold1.g5846.t1
MQTKLLYPEEWTQEVKDWAEAARGYNQSRGVSRLPDGAAVAHALQLRSPAPACRYHIDHQYRVILTINYAGATQTAGRALSSAFGFITDSTKCAADPNACDRACAGRSLCLNRTTLEALCPFWKVYTVFGVARNPLELVALINARPPPGTAELTLPQLANLDANPGTSEMTSAFNLWRVRRAHWPACSAQPGRRWRARLFIAGSRDEARPVAPPPASPLRRRSAVQERVWEVVWDVLFSRDAETGAAAGAPPVPGREDLSADALIAQLLAEDEEWAALPEGDDADEVEGLETDALVAQLLGRHAAESPRWGDVDVVAYAVDFTEDAEADTDVAWLLQRLEMAEEAAAADADLARALQRLEWEGQQAAAGGGGGAPPPPEEAAGDADYALALQEQELEEQQAAAAAAAPASGGGIIMLPPGTLHLSGGGRRPADDGSSGLGSDFPTLAASAAAAWQPRALAPVAHALGQQMQQQHRAARAQAMERGSGVRLLSSAARGGTAPRAPQQQAAAPRQPARAAVPLELDGLRLHREDDLDDTLLLKASCVPKHVKAAALARAAAMVQPEAAGRASVSRPPSAAAAPCDAGSRPGSAYGSRPTSSAAAPCDAGGGGAWPRPAPAQREEPVHLEALGKVTKTSLRKVEADMLERGWKPMRGGRGGHIKFKRVIPELDNLVQVQVLCSTPSDRAYIHNLRASLARADWQVAEERARAAEQGAAAALELAARRRHSS